MADVCLFSEARLLPINDSSPRDPFEPFVTGSFRAIKILAVLRATAKFRFQARYSHCLRTKADSSSAGFEFYAPPVVLFDAICERIHDSLVEF